MTIQTPEQIAQAMMKRYDIDTARELSGTAELLSMMESAIEADRAQRAPEPEDEDFVVSVTTGVTIPLKGARIVRNFSPELHAEDPENIVFYAEAHGKAIA